MKEETGLTTKNITPYGILLLEYQKGIIPKKYEEIHVFRADHYSGELIESNEMKSKWFDVNKLPYDKMWPDDKHWMPYFLKV